MNDATQAIRLAFTRREAAESLGISVATLDALTKEPGGPPFVRLGDRGVRYSVKLLEKWLEQRATAEQATAVQSPD